MAHQTIVVIDFGSQYTQLIARRLRELSVYSEVVPFHEPLDAIVRRHPAGIILSGGPRSVTDHDAPRIDAGVFDGRIPVLGICYGMQLMTATLGGKVGRASQREYGPATIRADEARGCLFKGLPPEQPVWASHGDFVEAPPPGFAVVASSTNAAIVGIQSDDRRHFGVLFHPEVVHTAHGTEMLRRFAFDVCGCTGDWTIGSYVDESVRTIREQVGGERVVCALSGGVDSAVAAVLIQRAIGDRLTCVFVDNGMLRLDEARQVRKRLADKLHVHVEFVDASVRFIDALRGVTDPEQKRKIIGGLFIDVFEESSARLGGFAFLAQGTLYPDVIESVSVIGPSAAIKSHHNVGGLPERMRFTLVEPLRQLFKDEVRALGRALGLDEEFVTRQPFPGPGLAVRVVGEITAERLDLLRRADAVVVDEIRRHGWYHKVWQSFAVLLPVRSVGVMGDERTYDYAIAVRAVESLDGMTADWARLPPELLASISSRLVNDVRGVNRVVYDISSKPPSTIEWE